MASYEEKAFEVLLKQAEDDYDENNCKVFRLQLSDKSINSEFARFIEIGINAYALGGGISGLICALIRYELRDIPTCNEKVITQITRKHIKRANKIGRDLILCDYGNLYDILNYMKDCNDNKDLRSFSFVNELHGYLDKNQVRIFGFEALAGFAYFPYVDIIREGNFYFSRLMGYTVEVKSFLDGKSVEFAPLTVEYEECVIVIEHSKKLFDDIIMNYTVQDVVTHVCKTIRGKHVLSVIDALIKCRYLKVEIL